MRYALEKIRLIHVLILALFEFVTLFLISLFGIDTASFNPLGNALGGLAVGFLGALPLIVFLNILSGILKIDFRGGRVKLSVLAAGVYNGIFLALLFFIEAFTSGLKSWNLLLGNALAGAITTPISLLIIILLYNSVPLKISFGNGLVEKIGIKGIVITAAVYEAIALPLMALLGKGYLANPHLAFALTGLISGLIGGMVALAAYNLFLTGSIYVEAS